MTYLEIEKGNMAGRHCNIHLSIDIRGIVTWRKTWNLRRNDANTRIVNGMKIDVFIAVKVIDFKYLSVVLRVENCGKILFELNRSTAAEEEVPIKTETIWNQLVVWRRFEPEGQTMTNDSESDPRLRNLLMSDTNV